ncbi:MAG TPA: ABC transporter substrate-binding protein, partial [Solirubrobacteraceae bacterium]|nr:ABC transporter substrate-binding protein [Solirubrobacteraceae bacterium]
MRQSRSSGRSRRRVLLPTLLVAVLALVAAGCGSSSGNNSSSASGGASSSASSASGGSSGGSLTVADVAPFTGTDGALGPTYLVACSAATHAINAAGGILGHQMGCKTVDTRGDPADAVPAVHQMYASGSPALVIGCTSDEAASVVPIFGANHTVSFCMTGQSEFDHVKFPYFYRLVPPDLSESYAMTAIAQDKGYKKVALAFGNDIGSQTFVQPALAALKKAGITVTANETLDLNATTFRTEAATIVNSHPDAIMTEALGPTEASFMSEVKQLNGGKMIPIIGTSATISPDWYKSVAAAVGAGDLASNFLADNLVVDTSGATYKPF